MKGIPTSCKKVLGPSEPLLYEMALEMIRDSFIGCPQLASILLRWSQEHQNLVACGCCHLVTEVYK
jgi:hypothetical protein